MDTAKLRRFAQEARRSLMEQVTSRMKIVLAPDSAARRESPRAVSDLLEAVESAGEQQVIERAAYTWFNRFCALRFMDVNRYTRVGAVSPAEGQSQPEMLADAKMGHIDSELGTERIRQQIRALLDGQVPSGDPQSEAYRLLLVAACNHWNKPMPFMFQKIEDYTELLLPDDLLSDKSILAQTREALTADDCEDVEVIGWLYQFYISEKKDEVFEGLKKNRKITPENIPAATQLFTPHWIVQYLVQNSLGRLWLLNRPNSRLAEAMEYYIPPETPEQDFLEISRPEEIRVCDPACGSGHMLTYAFDLLYAMYEEDGYDPVDIPELILTNNLYGIEIDERAGALAAFALAMKARAKHRRFFSRGANPNICVLRNVTFEPEELERYMAVAGPELFTPEVRETLELFGAADNFGSLITPAIENPEELASKLDKLDLRDDMFLQELHERVTMVVQMAGYLAPRYQVVVANPPYLGSKGMNSTLSNWARKIYPRSKADLFAMFIERCLDLTGSRGAIAMITMQSWMFLSSYEALRERILGQYTIVSMAHLGARAFDSIGGEVVATTAFVIDSMSRPDHRGAFLRLVAGRSEQEKKLAARQALSSPSQVFRASSSSFFSIPGYQIAYWISAQLRNTFARSSPLAKYADVGKGLDTGDNDRFLKYWHELSTAATGWFPCQKGGPFRKWFGNNEFVINWADDGAELRGHSKSNIRNAHNYFRPGLSWSRVSSRPAFRYFRSGHIFESTGPAIFSSSMPDMGLLGFLNSKVAKHYLEIIAPTMDFQSGHVASLPILTVDWQDSNLITSCERCVALSVVDWEQYETAAEFKVSPLIEFPPTSSSLAVCYSKLRRNWAESTSAMLMLEVEVNRILIDAYGLQDELSPDVPLNEITLTGNPQYRYSGEKSQEELETLLLADTMREFISYAVGCMFGRYSLDKPGLILANQGESVEDYLKQVPEPIFAPDVDNVIPFLDGDWFTDDVTERFKEFLRVTFGEEHYEENLRFIEDALNVNGRRSYSIRDFFLNEFYDDHVRRYKKRPIYWMFSSPKGSFRALIYMHRYRPDTVSVVLNNYLREFRTKLVAQRDQLEAVSVSTGNSPAEKTRALRDLDRLSKIISELEDYEHDVLYPLAAQQVEIDLDDGVKVNYPKFGTALRKIPGL